MTACRRSFLPSVDLLVLGDTIVTMDQTRRIIDNGGITISNSRIVAIGPRAEIERTYTSHQGVNAVGKVISPGLINGHTHVPMVLFRWLADDLDLTGVVTKYIFLNDRVIATHMVWPQGTDIAILKRLGVAVVHNPQSNMKLASESRPFRR